jgi:hypothetical protein
MVKLIDHCRIQGLHTRARELIKDAEHERDPFRRQYLMDLASVHERVAAAFEVRSEKETEPARSPIT